MADFDPRPLGALPADDGVQFRVWAPGATNVDLLIEPDERMLSMDAGGAGYFELFVNDLRPGTRYEYRLDGGPALPDPVGRFQPEGVHGPSQVVDPARYTWGDEAWPGLPQDELVFYELHVGAFTLKGTFAAARKRLDHLKDLGVTAIELMPVADFPGRWNWGYDQAALFAPSRAYGPPDELRALVDAAHQKGLAVFLDVVYNHLGPDGAYAAAFMPMFTEKHQTPWGAGINLDDTNCEGVRHFLIENAQHWLREYHFDGLRLDATFALEDDSEVHFLEELALAVDDLEGPPRCLIAEDHRNLNTLILPREQDGYGLDGVWVDDFHHQVRHLTAGDRAGYYADFDGMACPEIATTLRDGWFFRGQMSEAMGHPRGTDPDGIRPDQCVFFIQNHDQIGNRPQGNRLTDDIELPVYRAATALLLFAPEMPLLFMGQEWAASSPFQFFTDHEPELGQQVREGRKEEFQGFPGFQSEVPDPQNSKTFRRSKLDWDEREKAVHARTLALYRDLLALRRALDGSLVAKAHGDTGLALRRGAYHLLVAFTGGQALPWPDDATLVLHTEQSAYARNGQPPRIEDDRVHFPRAGAIVARTASE